MAAHQVNVHGIGRKGSQKHSISNSIQNCWCMVTIKRRLTFSQFYFMFVCKPSTDSVLSYCLPLEGTTYVSFPSWARILGRNRCQSSGWGCSKVNALPHLCWCADHLPAHALAPTCPHSQQQAPVAPWARATLQPLDSALQVPRKRCTLEGRSCWWHIDVMPSEDHSEVWSSPSPETPVGLTPAYFPWNFV